MTLRRKSFNYTFNSEFVEYLRNESYLEFPWFINRNAKWDGRVDPPFAEVLTNYGFGNTFNLIENSKLLKEEA